MFVFVAAERGLRAYLHSRSLFNSPTFTEVTHSKLECCFNSANLCAWIFAALDAWWGWTGEKSASRDLQRGEALSFPVGILKIRVFPSLRAGQHWCFLRHACHGEKVCLWSMIQPKRPKIVHRKKTILSAPYIGGWSKWRYRDRGSGFLHWYTSSVGIQMEAFRTSISIHPAL